MKKNTLKYFIDVALYIDICSIAVIGVLLAFVIPEGRKGAGAKYFLGLHRHDWGDIHLFLSILLLVFLVFHLRYNWIWIVQSTKSYFGENWKNTLWFFSGAWILVLVIVLAIKLMVF